MVLGVDTGADDSPAEVDSTAEEREQEVYRWWRGP